MICICAASGTDRTSGQEGRAAMRRTRTRYLGKAILVGADVELLDVIKAVLMKEAHLQVVTVIAPELVLPLIEATAPGVVLLDLNLPEQRGWELLAALRERPRFSTLPVLLLTASREDAEQIAAQNDPWADSISKPFDLDVVLQHIQRLIQPPPDGTGEPQQGEARAAGSKLLALVLHRFHQGEVGK
jgi:DNA-binding response OmpR family regulator